MEPKIIVNGKEYPFVTEDDLTLGEAAEIERITGQGYDLANLGALGLLALTYVSVKRHDPNIRVEHIELLKGPDLQLLADEPEGEPVPPESPVDSPLSDGPSTPSSVPDSAATRDAILEPSGTPV